MIDVVVPLAWALLSAGAPAGAGETTVRERRPGDVDDVRLDHPAPTAPEESLLAVPGVSLVRSGGPLAPVRPVVRGLSGSRLDVSALGLPFLDPAAGDVDAGLWPWALGTVDVDVGAGAGTGGLGGSVSLLRPAPGLFAEVTAGELSTLRGSLRFVDDASAGDDDGDGAVRGIAVSAGSTRGDFAYAARDANEDAGGRDGLTVRTNNDQRRASLAAFADVPVADRDVVIRAAAVAGVHEGGIPGFATAPLPTLRGRRALGALGVGLSARPQDDVVVDVDAWGQGSERATGTSSVDRFGARFGQDADVLLGTRVGGRGRARARLIDGVDGVDGGSVDGAVVVDAARGAIPGFALRHEGALAGGLVLRAPFHSPIGALVARLDVDGGVRRVDDDDDAGRDDDDDNDNDDDGDNAVLLPTGAVRASLTRAVGARALTGFVGVTRAARAPTLDERFAPQGFVLGNAGLLPEAVSELELGVVVVVDAVRVRGVAHGSIIDDAIVLVNRSAFSVVPVNSGAARRAGVDVGATLQPLPVFGVDVSASLLHSELLATGAPLPQAPPFLLRAVARLADDIIGVDLVVTARGDASSTLFGTLRAPGFALLDVIGRWSIADNVDVTGTMQNALDVRDARDTNLLPLPGRLFFLSLSVTA